MGPLALMRYKTVVDGIRDHVTVVALPFVESAASDVLSVLRSLAHSGILSSEVESSDYVTNDFTSLADALVDCLLAISEHAHQHLEDDFDTEDPISFLEFASMTKDFINDVQALATTFSTLGPNDPNWFRICVEMDSILPDIQRQQLRAAEMKFWPERPIKLALRPTPIYETPLPPTPSDAPAPRSAVPAKAGSMLLQLAGEITHCGSGRFPAAYGGFADVWQGVWSTATGQYKVAIKVPRLHTQDDRARRKQHRRLRRELLIWSRLQHKHVLELYGITTDFGPPASIGMVCPWVEHGNLTSYLNATQKEHFGLADRHRICRGFSRFRAAYNDNGPAMRSCLGAFISACVVGGSRGPYRCMPYPLTSLHRKLTPTVYDNEQSNVLIDSQRQARISDFGLSSIVAEFQETSSNSAVTGAVRWTAPELYHVQANTELSVVSESQSPPPAPRPTVQTDVYSFGSIMLQTLSGKIPYYYLRTDGQVFFELYKNLHPRRPFEPWISDAHWDFMKRCWADAAEARPQMNEIEDFVQKYYDILMSAPVIQAI